MTFGSICLLAVGLSMDAAAVSAARGMAAPVLRLRHVLLVALFFGGFQALMPLLGWQLGAQLGPQVQAWDHWIAFLLLGGIGAKMVWEALSPSPDGVDEGDRARDLFGLKVMLGLAIATSIDALAVGMTLPLLKAPVALSFMTIGGVAALLSALALLAGRRFGALLGPRLELAGGLLLIALGTKILLEHLRHA